MKGNIITLFENIFHIGDMFDLSGKLPCGIYRNIWIISVYFHTKINRSVGNHCSDGSQTDDTEFLSFDLAAGKLFFLFFCQFSNIFVIFFLFYPFHTAYDITGCKEHAGDYHFFDTVCVGSRCIEYDDTLLCTIL